MDHSKPVLSCTTSLAIPSRANMSHGSPSSQSLPISISYACSIDLTDKTVPATPGSVHGKLIHVMLYPQLLQDLFEHMGSKVRTLTTLDYTRIAKSREKLSSLNYCLHRYRAQGKCCKISCSLTTVSMYTQPEVDSGSSPAWSITKYSKGWLMAGIGLKGTGLTICKHMPHKANVTKAKINNKGHGH